MAKKAKTPDTNDVDELLEAESEGATNGEAKPAKAKKAKAEKPAAKKAAKEEKPAAKAAAKKAAKPAAKKAPAAKADKEPKEPRELSPVRKALLKVKKAISYADFAEANDFDIRSVRRTARVMRDAGEIELTKDGQLVYISAAV